MYANKKKLWANSVIICLYSGTTQNEAKVTLLRVIVQYEQFMASCEATRLVSYLNIYQLITMVP